MNKKSKLKVSYAVENRVLQKKKENKLLSLIQILNLRTMVKLRCHGLIGIKKSKDQHYLYTLMKTKSLERRYLVTL